MGSTKKSNILLGECGLRELREVVVLQRHGSEEARVVRGPRRRRGRRLGQVHVARAEGLIQVEVEGIYNVCKKREVGRWMYRCLATHQLYLPHGVGAVGDEVPHLARVDAHHAQHQVPRHAKCEGGGRVQDVVYVEV